MDVLSPEWVAQQPPEFQALSPDKQRELVERIKAATDTRTSAPIDRSSGGPYKTRMAVQGAHTPEDQLLTAQKLHPGARRSEDQQNILIPDEGGYTQLDPSGFDFGDVLDFAPEAAEFGGQLAGAAGGGMVGNIPGAIVGAGVGGAAGRELYDEAAKRWLGTVDTRSGGDRLLDAGITGAFNAAGQGAGYLVPGVVKRMFGPRLPGAAQVAQDFADIGARPLPGTVTGNEGMMRVERGLESTPGGAAAAGDIARQINSAASNEMQNIIRGTGGAALEPYEMGQELKRGAKIANRNYQRERKQLYDRAFDIVGDQTPVDMRQIQAYRDQLEQKMLDANGMLDKTIQPQLDELDTILGTQGNSKQQRFGPLREKRTQISEQYESPPVGWQGKSNKKFTRDLRSAITGDLKDTARFMGGEREIAEADQFMADFMAGPAKHLQEIRDETSEGAFRYVMRGTKDDLERLIHLKRQLPDDSWRNFQATMLEQMGRPAAGRSTGETFSTAEFLSNYNKLTDQTKNLLFGNTAANRQGVALRTALDRLMRVSQRLKDASRTQNYSNSANVGVGAAIGAAAGGDIMAGKPGRAALTVTAGGLAPYLTLKLMTSPRFVNWLAGARQAAAGSPKEIMPWVGRLTQIGVAEPALKDDITALAQAMTGQGSARERQR